jgi:hypothetical protein
MIRVLSAVFAVVFLLALSAGSALAKKDTFIDVGGTYVGNTESDESGVDTEIQRTIFWIGGKYPIQVGEKNYLTLGIKYKGQFIDYDDFIPFPIPQLGATIYESDLPDELHALDFSAGYLATWTDKWSTYFSLEPGIHSDWEDIDGDDWVITGTVLAMYKFGEKDVFGFGVAHSDAFGEAMPFPLLKLFWYPTEKFYVETLLPIDLDAGYRFNNELSAGLEGKLLGYQYRLSEDRPWDDSVLRYREVQAGPYINFHFSERANLRLSAGVVTAQKFEIRDDDNDDKYIDGDYKDSWYGTLNFFMTF